MLIKRVLRPERLRRVPAQFSWIDQRLVREGYVGRCSPEALALYLFLVTVADAQGLSYYGDAALGRCLSMEPARIAGAQVALIDAGLIAWERPLYQVLALDPPPPPREPGTHPIQSRLAQLQASLRQRTRSGAPRP